MQMLISLLLLMLLLLLLMQVLLLLLLLLLLLWLLRPGGNEGLVVDFRYLISRQIPEMFKLTRKARLARGTLLRQN